jgi:glyoxylase-like metal-dependent hydrolase (beta-lactamase superfamily II)
MPRIRAGRPVTSIKSTLTQIGPRSYNFAWPIGFYNTVFTVTDEGVIALDPISRDAAAAYRRAIAEVTDKPIRYVVYSHDHLDHIAGAEILAPDAPIVAHKDVPALLIHRGLHREVPLPTVLVDGCRTLELGEERWELLYLGPNHGRANLAVLNRKERWVALIDVVSPGLVPYRDLPLSDIPGFIYSLDRIAELPVDTIMDGHLPPSPIIWVNNYRRYFRDLVDITRQVRTEIDEASIQLELPPGADGVAMTERMFQRTSAIVVDRLRPAYGEWGAFAAWAPQNVTRALIYLITGE